jgi:hypothetical protein
MDPDRLHCLASEPASAGLLAQIKNVTLGFGELILVVPLPEDLQARGLTRSVRI